MAYEMHEAWNEVLEEDVSDQWVQSKYVQPISMQSLMTPTYCMPSYHLGLWVLRYGFMKQIVFFLFFCCVML